MLDKNAAGIEVNSVVTPQTPKAAIAQCTVAHTTQNAPVNGSLVQLLQAGARGGRLTKLKAIPAVTVAATQLQLYRSQDAGATRRFMNSALMAAYTMAANTLAPQTDFGYSDANPLQLAPNEILYVAIGVANAINFEAEWADY